MATNKALLLAIFSLLLVSSALANNCMYTVMANVGGTVPPAAVITATVIGQSGQTVAFTSMTLMVGTNTFGPSGNSDCFNPCQVRLIITGGMGTVTINTISVTRMQGNNNNNYMINGTPVNLALPANQVIGTCN